MSKRKDESKEPRVRIERFAEQLLCPLTPGEIAERADRAAHLLSERDALEAQAKEALRAAKAQIGKLDGEHRRLSSEVREKVTARQVRCERRFYYEKNLVIDVRLDTGEEMHRREMTGDESQLPLDLEDEFGDESDDEGGDAPPPEPKLATEKKRRGRPRKAREEAAE